MTTTIKAPDWVVVLRRAAPGLLSIVVRGAAAGLSVALGVVVARLYGPIGAGSFYLALSTLLYATTIARAGTDQSLLRRVAQSHGRQEGWLGEYTFSILIGSTLSVVAGGMVYFASGLLTSDDFSRHGTLILSLGILPGALIWINSGVLQGKGQVHRAVFLQAICTPLIALPLLFLSDTVVGALWYYLAAIIVTALISFVWVFRQFGAAPFRAPPRVDKGFLKASANLAVVSLMNIAQNWLPITLAALFVSTYDVGLVSAAMRISAVGAMVLTALNSYAAPTFARLHGAKDLAALQSRVDEISTLGFMLGLPLILTLVLFPHWVISLFGPEFHEAAGVLVVLAIGQFVIFATGAGSVLLAMTGHDRALKNATLLSVAVMAAGSVAGLALTGSYFAVAWASTLAVAVQNILICVVARRELGLVAWFDPLRLLRRLQRT